MSDLAEHFERIAWARGEIERLERQLTTYVESGPLEIYSKLDFREVPTVKFYRLRLRSPVPRTAQIHAGTIVNEMRAILDALACTLAARNDADRLDNTYFPTGKDKAIFESKEVQRKIKYLSDIDKQTIAELKPYGGGNDMLYALHSTDLIRKHQRLIVLGNEIGQHTIEPGILDGSKIYYIRGGYAGGPPIAKVEPGYNLKMKVTPIVAFSEPDAIKTKPVVTTLHDFASLVEAILNLFDA